MTGGRVRALLAVLVTLVLGGAILGVGQGGDDAGSGSGTTAATQSGAGGDGGSGEANGSGGEGGSGDADGGGGADGASAVQALGVLGGRGRKTFEDEGCAGCHRLADAGATGRIGPDLDAVLTDQDEAKIREGIVDPQAEATPGFTGAQMPDRYDELPAEDLDALVKYLAAATKG
ncbi:c-type cytochrome [Patulibacter americanus]|uniref:c-type cytochrome n=1 Tax=Patulibacter americanus TaxID=588672 RepID=UPI0003B4A3E0|nr:c-type cytochrome [Patulibacter americanus]